MSLKYAADRVTFGKPIATRQAIKMKIANMQMNIHALRCMVYDFAKDYEVKADGTYIEEKAAMCKLFSIDTVRLVSDEMLEALVTLRIILMVRLSACTGTAAPCGWRKAPPPYSALPLQRARLNSAVR